ncbi:hypothetical protein EC973_008824 [Apophysomyces ossiformis]|uniref:VPS9 domain-containing protein n=1 Tax=Apophysomyces ossiformis TaxID=679940 RepID=A0A8H7BXC2_9FUNG|nr:hypothetical protein EC973_008824 [Apophysomyces ossiformis]
MHYHPLLQGVLNEPRLSTNRLSIILLPPSHELRPVDGSFEFLASHVIPLASSFVITSTSDTLQRTTTTATTTSPLPRPSLSASSVFSRIKSPKTPFQKHSDQHEAVLTTVNEKPVIVRNNVITMLTRTANIIGDACLYTEDGDAIKHVLLYLDRSIVPCGDHSSKNKTVIPKPQPSFKDILLKHQGDALNRLVQEFCDAVIEMDDREQVQKNVEELMSKGYDLVLDDDIHISTLLDRMYCLDFNQVGLPPIPNGRERVQRAIDIFEKIGSYRTPSEKLDCLLATINQLISEQDEQEEEDEQEKEKESLDSDSLVPLLLLTILRSRVPHLLANLIYMKDYTFERNVTVGSHGFALSTFEGVLHYIRESSDPLIQLAGQNLTFWSAIRHADTPTVVRFYESPDLFATVCDARDDHGNDALIMACRTGQAELVDYILQKQRTRVVNHEGQTPLMAAIQAESPKTLSILLRDHHVLKTINARDKHGNTAFLIACRQRTDAYISLLLDIGAEPNVSNHLREGPFHIACRHASSQVVRTLLNSASSMLSWQDLQGTTFFHVCEDPVLFKECMSHPNAQVDRLDKHRQTPLLLWAAKGRLDIVELLMNCGAVSRYRLDEAGQSVLHLISQRLLSKDLVFGEFGLEDVLHRFSLLVNVRNEVGETALHIAAVITSPTELSIRFIRCLVAMGASLEALNGRGERAIDQCRSAELMDAMDDLHLEQKMLLDDKEHPPWAVTRVSANVQDHASDIHYIVRSGWVNV